MGYIQNRFGWRDSFNTYFKYPDVAFFTRMYFGYHLCCTNNYRLKTASLSSLQYSIDRYHWKNAEIYGRGNSAEDIVLVQLKPVLTIAEKEIMPQYSSFLDITILLNLVFCNTRRSIRGWCWADSTKEHLNIRSKEIINDDCIDNNPKYCSNITCYNWNKV
jgi:hypothetical protein